MENKNQVLALVNRKWIENAEKVLTYGLPLLYFLTSIAFYLKTYDSAQIKITLVQVGGAVLLCAWLFKMVEENALPFFEKNMVIVIPLLLFLVSGFASWMHSPFYLASAQEFSRRLFYITFCLIAVKEFDSDEKIGRLMFWLFFAAYVATLYGVVQFLDTRFFPPNPEPGLDPFIWRGAFGPRVFSTFGNPNFFGDFLVVMSPITLSAFIRTRKFNYLLLWVLIAFNILFTGSKGAWLGGGVGFVAILLIYFTYFSHVNKEKVRKVLFGFVIVTLLVLTFGMYHSVKKRSDSVSFRVFTWVSAWEMINSNPILGTGIGTFYVTYPAYRRPQIFYIEGRHNTETDHPEEEYLEVWYDEGLVGFGIFIWIIALYMLISTRNLSSFVEQPGDKRAFYQLGLMSALIAQLAHNMVCVSLRFVSSGIFLWLVIGLIGALNTHNPLPAQAKQLPLNDNPIPKGPRRFIQLILILVTLYFVKIFYGYFDGDVNHNIAIMFSKQGQWIPALDHYNTVVTENPSFIMAHYFMGNVYNDRWMEGDPQRSIDKYKDVWKLAPNYVQSRHQAGMIYFKWGSDEKRLADEAAKAGNMAVAGAHQKRQFELWREAISQFERYRKIDPVFPLNYYREATIYIQMGDYNSAAEVYKQHIALPETLLKPPHNPWVEEWGFRRAPELSETCLYLGNLYYVQNQFDNAEKYFKMGVDIPTEAMVYMKQHFNIDTDLNSSKIAPLKNLATLYTREKKYDLARAAWEQLARISPNDPDVQKVFHK